MALNSAEEHMLRCALVYADELGWPVFPCKPNQKVPNCPHGVHDATTDTERIERWWGSHPNDNIGLACGIHLDALDIEIADPLRET